ncbi:MAG TPA: glycosyltransferase [Candidatus Aenigmarchaeota archaeon]|nr:MAG: hypothetical protein DRP03_02235 [Candidatus Aenigmarchaeota archaeon]HDD46375.1 glycosyltransferase [Candidatus Aenigmarchaeota archaeon]
MEWMDYIYLGMYWFMIYTTVLFMLVFIKNRKYLWLSPEVKEKKTISFIVPAYNEEKNIARCIDSLLSLDYPKDKVEIFVVNDGSTDRTREICERYAREGKIKLINKKNSGKASSINMVLPMTKGELVAVLDADSVVSKDYVNHMIGYFEDERVAAVTPAIKPLDANNIVKKIQWVEYMFQIYLRKAFDFFKAQYVIPGAGSIYRGDVIRRLKFDENGNLTEDTEIGFRMHEKGYEIRNSLNAVVYTDIPDTFGSLVKQRLRWYRGYLQNVRKYSYMILNRKFGNLGMFLIPANFIWITILFLLVILPGINLANDLYIRYLNWAAVDFEIIWPSFNPDTIFLSLGMYNYYGVLFLSLTFLTLFIGAKASKEELGLIKKRAHYFAYIFLYPMLITFFWVSATIQELLKVERKW